MLLCPTKLRIREGSIHWPWMCTCKHVLTMLFCVNESCDHSFTLLLVSIMRYDLFVMYGNWAKPHPACGIMLIKDAIIQESFRRAQGLLTVPPQNPQSPDISSVCVSKWGHFKIIQTVYGIRSKIVNKEKEIRLRN